jgi:hypothetical protein
MSDVDSVHGWNLLVVFVCVILLTISNSVETLTHLPTECLRSILCFLDLRTAVRVLVVCKQWYTALTATPACDRVWVEITNHHFGSFVAFRSFMTEYPGMRKCILSGGK